MKTSFTEPDDDSLFSKFPLSPAVKVIIVIPVKNEEDYILNSLSAFSCQTDVLGNPLDLEHFEILILANNCTDNSVLHIKDFQKKHPDLHIRLEVTTLQKSQANIGYVRKVLMEAAYHRLMRNGGGIIMTTDGDTVVAPDWIAQTQKEIEAGADAVGGRILLCQKEVQLVDQWTLHLHTKDETYHLLIAELESLILKTPHDTSPRHHQHFNGSFAVTTDCYGRSGGIPDVAYLEDCAFFERLEHIDAKVRHSNKVRVHTSARTIGRTEVGLSYQLNVWKNLGAERRSLMVESAASIVSKLVRKRNLIELWNVRKCQDFNIYETFKKITNEIPTDDMLYHSFLKSPFFGEWYSKFKKLEEIIVMKKFPRTCLDQALVDLQKEVAIYSAPSFSQTSIR